MCASHIIPHCPFLPMGDEHDCPSSSPLRPLDRADDEAHGAEQAGDGGRRLAGVTAEQVGAREAIGGLLAQIGDQAVGPKVGHAHLERVLALL